MAQSAVMELKANREKFNQNSLRKLYEYLMSVTQQTKKGIKCSSHFSPFMAVDIWIKLSSQYQHTVPNTESRV